MKRSVKLSLKFCTASKRRKLMALLDEQRRAVNAYIPYVHAGGGLNASTKARYHGGHLTSAQCSAALNQAIGICNSNPKQTGRRVAQPRLRDNACVTFSSTCSVRRRGSYLDMVVRIACLKRRKPIALVTRGTKVLKRWMSVPGARLVQGCAITDDYVTIWVDVPAMQPTGTVTGAVDIGYGKLLTYTDGRGAVIIGPDFDRVADKVRRKKPGSESRKRAATARDEYINRAAKALPWKKLKTLVVEDLRHIKTGKHKNRGKSFRKKLAPWTYCQLLKRIEETAELNRVQVVRVDPAFTSQTCPKCSKVSKLNRNGAAFSCVACGYKNDADIVGALNVLASGSAATTRGSVRYPRLQDARTIRL